MPFDTAAVLAREAVDRLVRSALDPQELFHEVGVRVRRVVPHDAAGWMTLDPDTLLPGTMLETEKPAAMVRAIWRNEWLRDDLNCGWDLTAAPIPVATLGQHDEAALAESERVQQILRPAGLGDELRAVLRSGGATWGLMALYRELGRSPFTPDERAFVAALTCEVAEGLRRGLLRRPAPDAAAGSLVPGVATLTGDGELRSATAEARRMIRLLPGDGAGTLFAVALGAAHDPEGARSRVRLPDGRWVLLHGARLHGEGSETDDMAVTLLPAPTAEIAPLLLRLHGLSAREREVAKLLMRGSSTDAIAARLHISPHTLRDHTKAIFQKVGATSRPELMALGADPLDATRS